jgi:hypothetical protein
LLPHSPSSLKCEKGKAYNEKMQFAHIIIQDLCKIRTYAVEFLYICKRGWSSSVQARPRITSVDLVNIEESEEDKGVEQRFVDTQTM